jgi:hypothetical protein
MAAWVYVHSYHADGRYIFQIQDNSGHTIMMGLLINGSGKIHFFVRGSENVFNSYDFDTAIGTGEWKHVAITCSGTGGTVRAYLNGVQESTTRSISATNVSAPADTTPLMIGCYAQTGLARTRVS